VYTKNALNADGTVKVVTTTDIVYDTLSNGKIIARDLPGEIAKIPIDEEETYLRSNFSTSDNRNFRDGDKRSSRYYRESFDEGEDKEGAQTGKMYNSPQHMVGKDSTGMLREYDKSNSRTSLINDEVRVYKGGSWRDRAYWIDPAQRRFFPQDMATDYIGFRCAVSRVGSKSQKGGKKRN
jgi:gliding motility-associated lipoprotein GldJ